MNSTKKMTEAALLTSLFIVTTIVSVSTGFGYAVYLDFAVPIFFCIICLKCDFKYTVLSSISSLLIVSLVLGNIGTAIWMIQSIILGLTCGVLLTKSTTIIDDFIYGSILGVILMVFVDNIGTAIWMIQSIILGLTCGVLLTKSTTIIDDFIYGSILGVILMVFVDIYASTLIGYSFMNEFQGYANMFTNKRYIDLVYYILIALLPMGTIFSVYFLSLLLGKKLNILKENSKKKLYMMKNFRTCGRYICSSKKVFYSCVIYILFIEILNLIGLRIEQTYIKTILISSEYICLYFVIRDAFILVQNYILLKYKKILNLIGLRIEQTYIKTILISSEYICLYFVIRDAFILVQNYILLKYKKAIYIRIFSIIVAVSLVFLLKITTAVLVIFNVILDKRVNIRINQTKLVNNYVNQLIYR